MIRLASARCCACVCVCVLQCRLLGMRVAVTHLRSSSRASRPSASRSSLVLRGLMARTSPGSILTSVGSTASTDSRGTMIVPLLFRLGRRGRTGTGAMMPGVLDWSTEDAEDESERVISGILGGRTCSCACVPSSIVEWLGGKASPFLLPFPFFFLLPFGLYPTQGPTVGDGCWKCGERE